MSWKALLGTKVTFREQEVEITKEGVVAILYENWQGQTMWRLVFPLPAPPELKGPEYKFHPGEWVFPVWDLVKDAERSYAFSGVRQCKPLREWLQMFPEGNT